MNNLLETVLLETVKFTKRQLMYLNGQTDDVLWQGVNHNSLTSVSDHTDNTAMFSTVTVRFTVQ